MLKRAHEGSITFLGYPTSETVVKPTDKPINCNNKHIQAMFLIIQPKKVLYTQATPLQLQCELWITQRTLTVLFISQEIKKKKYLWTPSG